MKAVKSFLLHLEAAVIAVLTLYGYVSMVIPS